MAAISPAQAFADHYDEIFRYLYRRVGGELAEELAAETFATAFANWRRFDQARPVAPWLYGIATNLLLRQRRAEARQLTAYSRTGVDPAVLIEDDAVAAADAQLRMRAVAAGLAAMRPQEREVLLLHAWADLSDEEIAAALDVPLGTVKSRLSRARTRLGNYLGLIGEGAAR
jgi:RNA polymerase sigma-70 factor (ECF subfamily)